MKKYQKLFDDEGNTLPKLNRRKFTIEEYIIYIYYYDNNIKLLLNEANQKGNIKLSGMYSAQRHSPHNIKGEYHIHIYSRNNQIGALNKSGSTHDSFHGVQLPHKVVDALKHTFKGYNIPDDGFLEDALSINPKLKLYEASINNYFNE